MADEPLADWLYLFTKNPDYPEPLGEISDLVAVAEEGSDAYLLLPDRETHVPMSAARAGEVVLLCTRSGSLRKHAVAVVGGRPVRFPRTPASVDRIYGDLRDRWFVPLASVESFPEQVVTELTGEQAATFAKGQAFVKRLGAAARPRPPERRPAQAAPVRSTPKEEARYPVRLDLRVSTYPAQAVHVLGLDPTAGTWETRMQAGPKPMPSVCLVVEPEGIIHPGAPLVMWHDTNRSFLDRIDALHP